MKNNVKSIRTSIKKTNVVNNTIYIIPSYYESLGIIV